MQIVSQATPDLSQQQGGGNVSKTMCICRLSVGDQGLETPPCLRDIVSSKQHVGTHSLLCSPSLGGALGKTDSALGRLGRKREESRWHIYGAVASAWNILLPQTFACLAHSSYSVFCSSVTNFTVQTGPPPQLCAL